jgi:prepilin-type N-terminal cleavage/methylation domain-containing protein
MAKRRRKTVQSGLSLMELLIVIAIIAILATLVIPNVSSIRSGTSQAVARQQQAALQTALGSWVSAASSGPGGLAAARSAYNSAGSKLGLLQNYLQPATFAALNGSGSSVSSVALSEVGASLQFSSWGIGGMPSVAWVGGQ